MEDSDREKRKTSNKNIYKKDKKFISDDQRFANKAKKAFKNKKREIVEEEIWEDIEYYDKFK
jgi:hypothetical protein